MPFAFGLEYLEDGTSHLIDHLRQRLGGINVDDEGIITLFDLFLRKAMPYQVRLSIAAGRDKGNIIAIQQPSVDVFRLLYAVNRVLSNLQVLGIFIALVNTLSVDRSING